MAIKVIHRPPIPASPVFIIPPVKLDTAVSLPLLPPTQNKPFFTVRFRGSPNPLSRHRRFSSHLSVKAENSSDLAAATEQQITGGYNRTQIKQNLFAALQGINRGIFGVTSEKKCEIENLVVLLESLNPTAQPTLSLEKVAGAWKLIYSTITILGSKRTKLGLRDFITLGDFIQSIDITELMCIYYIYTRIYGIKEMQKLIQGKAVNVIRFNAKGLNLLSGQLTIEASFKIASNSRVDISYNKSVITPDQLMNVFRKNYHLLLQIFNPEGWLEISYVDDSLRIGRDDKGNIFILERVEDDDKS